jgi:rhodanese-related sulfurtransferase
MMRRTFVTGSLLASMLCLASCRGIARRAVKEKVRHDFPQVRRIQADQLAEWLNDSRREPPLLLDVRTKAEYEASHLHGAQRVEPGSEAAETIAPTNKPIVTYCSVGYRSAALAQKLQAAGFKDVQNLEGSIFEWANEDRPLEQNGEPSTKVHPYSRLWGKLLKPSVLSSLRQ